MQAELRRARVDADEGRALRADLGTAGVQDRTAGSSSGAGSRWKPGRRPGAGRGAHEGGAHAGDRDLVLGARAGAHQRRRRRARRAREARGEDRRGAKQGGGARRRRLPGEPRVAHALSRARLGARQGARHALQHRRRDQDGARHRRRRRRQLVGLPRGGVGAQRARVRRSRGRRRVPEALLPVGHLHQRRRQALRRRGRRFPQLHLRQVRARDPLAARPVRLADLRQEGDPPAARRVPHQAGDEADREHAGGAGQEARRRGRRGGARGDQGLQRRGAAPRCRSTPTSRTGGARPAWP